MKRTLFLISIITAFFIYFLSAGNNGIAITYPAENTIFPPDIASPVIRFSGDAVGMNISLESGDTKIEGKINGKEWKPERGEWEKFKAACIGNNGKIVLNDRSGKELSSVKIIVSEDSVIAPIFFRDVPLPFKYALANLKEIKWRIGDISSDEPSTILMENIHVCANCHSFSANGRVLGMDVDAHSDKDAYGITDIAKKTVLYKMMHWSEYQDGEPTYGLLANISPSGRYIAATLKDHNFFVTRPDTAYSQLFFPIHGILVISDRHKGTYAALPGADDINYVQSNPSWSPDGREILFAKATAIKAGESGFTNAFDKDTSIFNRLADDFVLHDKKFKYDIYRIPFNEGRGGKAQPVPGASKNGKSNYYPRMSPDGKWIVFNQAESFMLLQPDSKLFIMPAEGGEPREMQCNSDNMNSWHSWSPNGKWLVFSSKMHDKYTRLYLTHIDENGNDSPPVLLENMWKPGRACNIPEFVNLRPGDFTELQPKFLDNDYFLYQNAVEKVKSGDLAGAEKNLDKAIALDSNNFKLYGTRGYVYMETGRRELALIDYSNGLKVNPKDSKLYNLRGHALLESGRIPEAYADFTKSIENNPNETEYFLSRGYLLVQAGKFREALPDLEKAIQLDRKNASAYLERGEALLHLGGLKAALKDLTKAIDLNPRLAQAYFLRAYCHLNMGHKNECCQDFDIAERLGLKAAKAEKMKVCGE